MRDRPGGLGGMPRRFTRPLTQNPRAAIGKDITTRMILSVAKKAASPCTMNPSNSPSKTKCAMRRQIAR